MNYERIKKEGFPDTIISYEHNLAFNVKPDYYDEDVIIAINQLKENSKLELW